VVIGSVVGEGELPVLLQRLGGGLDRVGHGYACGMSY
jgi:hypothetical protein